MIFKINCPAHFFVDDLDEGIGAGANMVPGGMGNNPRAGTDRAVDFCVVCRCCKVLTLDEDCTCTGAAKLVVVFTVATALVVDDMTGSATSSSCFCFTLLDCVDADRLLLLLIHVDVFWMPLNGAVAGSTCTQL